MNKAGLILPWVGAVLLAGVVILEWQAATRPEAGTPLVASLAVVPARPPEQPEGLADAWGSTALARPLFSPDRRPAALAANAGPRDLPRLTAVLIAPPDRTAIFAGSANARAVVVREGESIAGFVVIGIAPGSVTLRGPQGERSLRPLLVPSASPPGAAMPAPSALLGR